MAIHKLVGYADGTSIFLKVLCNANVMNKQKTTLDIKDVDCKKCLKLLSSIKHENNSTK